MINSHFDYLLRRIAELEKLLPKASEEKLKIHVCEFEAELKVLRERHRAKIKDGRTKTKAKAVLLHYDWAGEQPSCLDYDAAAALLKKSKQYLRNRISQAPGHAVAFYRGGRVQVLARTPAGLDAALCATFNKTGDPDDLLALAPKPRINTSSRQQERSS
jgi:hypothetical protein